MQPDGKVIRNYEVIIVGGGPAGAACATILAQNGIGTLICEKLRFPRDKICGECLNPRLWPLLERLGVAEALHRQNLRVIQRIEIYPPGGTKISLEPGNRSAPFVTIARRELDLLLLQNAVRQGADLMEETKVATLHHDGRWHVRVDGGTVSADYLVGADGRNSIVARIISRSRNRAQVRLRSAHRVGIQWHAPFQETLGTALAMFLFPGGYCGAVNVGTTANIAMVATRNLAQVAQKDFSLFLEKTIFANPQARSMLTSLQPLAHPATTFPLDPMIHHTDHPFALLIGDAHRTVEPFTGEGILFAVQEGISAGLLLTNRLRGTHHPATGVARPSWVESLFSLSFRRPVLGKVLLWGGKIAVIRHYLARAIFG